MGPSPSKRDDWLDEPICDSHAVQQLFSTSIAEVRRLPGWTWGVQVTGIGDAPPPVWPPELWLFVETAAMRHGLGLTQYAAGRFGLQSGRSGGCTHFANLGLSEDIRMWLGQWTSVRTQRGYMRTRIDQRFELVAKAEPTVGSCGGAAATGGGQR